MILHTNYGFPLNTNIFLQHTCKYFSLKIGSGIVQKKLWLRYSSFNAMLYISGKWFNLVLSRSRTSKAGSSNITRGICSEFICLLCNRFSIYGSTKLQKLL